MVSACDRSFVPGGTRNNFVAGVTATLLSAPAAVVTVSDALSMALIVPSIGGVFAGAAAGGPVCASAQTAAISAWQRQNPARIAVPAKTLRVLIPHIGIRLSSISLSWGGARAGLDTLQCRAGETYRLDGAKDGSRFIEFNAQHKV